MAQNNGPDSGDFENRWQTKFHLKMYNFYVNTSRQEVMCGEVHRHHPGQQPGSCTAFPGVLFNAFNLTHLTSWQNHRRNLFQWKIGTEIWQVQERRLFQIKVSKEEFFALDWPSFITSAPFLGRPSSLRILEPT